jgi:hypothetical protein
MKFRCWLIGHKWLRSRNFCLNYCVRCERWYIR